MRINFEDKSFVEIKLSTKPGNIEIVLGAIDFDNPLKKVINSAEINIKDFAKLVYGLGIQLPKIEAEKVESKIPET